MTSRNFQIMIDNNSQKLSKFVDFEKLKIFPANSTPFPQGTIWLKVLVNNFLIS